MMMTMMLVTMKNLQVRETACQGECHGNSCCRARKTKKKKVGMICEDGTRCDSNGEEDGDHHNDDYDDE